MGRYALAILIIAGCADSKRPTAENGAAGSASGNAGKGSSLSAAGRGGGAGGQHGPSGSAGTSATGGTGPASGPACRAREDEASVAVAAALAGAEEGCTTQADCEEISIDTLCHAACGALVSQRGKAAVQSAIVVQNAGICAGYADAGCTRIIPPCVPTPQEFDCVAGVCRYGQEATANDGGHATPDAGEPLDAGGSAQGCLAHALSWGPDGGLVAYQDRFSLEPCDTFRAERMGRADPNTSPSCENEVDAAAAITADDVDAALAHAQVQTAIAEAPVLYGVDSRPIDGTVFRIEIGGAVIELGRPCSAASCRQIPEGLAALREVLEDLTAQQLALDGCEELRR